MQNTVYSNWRALIKPRRVERDARSNRTYGKFVIRPLERGFGTTIGNSLRRILLSSLRGAAIIGCEIEGALHESREVPDVRIVVEAVDLEPAECVRSACGSVAVARAEQERADRAARLGQRALELGRHPGRRQGVAAPGEVVARGLRILVDRQREQQQPALALRSPQHLHLRRGLGAERAPARPPVQQQHASLGLPRDEVRTVKALDLRR